MRVSPNEMRRRLLAAGYSVKPNPEPAGPYPDWIEQIAEEYGPGDPNAELVRFRKQGAALNLIVVQGQPFGLIGCCDLFELAELTEGCGDDWEIIGRAAR